MSDRGSGFGGHPEWTTSGHLERQPALQVTLTFRHWSSGRPRYEAGGQEGGRSQVCPPSLHLIWGLA